MITIEQVVTEHTGVNCQRALCVFGSGDIGIGNKPEDKECWLTNSTTKPQEDWNPEISVTESLKEGETFVTLRFTNRKSIDNIIITLIELANQIEPNTEDIYTIMEGVVNVFKNSEGLEVEVLAFAFQYLKANPSATVDEALEYGFGEWVK